MTEIFIAGNVPSQKNSKEIVSIKGKNGKRRPMLISSKTVREYKKTYGFQWNLAENISAFWRQAEGKKKPLKVAFYFVRDSRRKFDYINACQLPCDLMTKAKWIEDDNMQEIVPFFAGCHYDKKNAGVYIRVLEDDDVLGKFAEKCRKEQEG